MKMRVRMGVGLVGVGGRRLEAVVGVLPVEWLMMVMIIDGRVICTYFLRLLSVTMHGTSSRRQFVQGAPCSTTLQRTLRARQHWQALEARLLTGLPFALTLRPALLALRFGEGGWEWSDSGEARSTEVSGTSAGTSVVSVMSGMGMAMLGMSVMSVRLGMSGLMSEVEVMVMVEQRISLEVIGQ